MKKNPYTISLWEDVPVAASYVSAAGTTFDPNQTYYTRSATTPYTYTKVENPVASDINSYYIFIPSHYGEKKIMDISADTMDALWRVREPKLVRNINGTHTLTFKILYHYIDTQTGESVENPLKKLLVNERKIKVYWKNKWYDLIIKNIQEDSSGKSFTYTCSDQYIQELSKNGYNLEFDNELENNMGTANALGAAILEGTDWSIDTSTTPIIQYKTENIYTIDSGEFKAPLSAKKLQDTPGDAESIPTNKQIYLFYSSVESRSARLDLYKVNDTVTYDVDTGIITGGVEQYFAEGISYTENNGNLEIRQNGTVVFQFSLNKTVDLTKRAKHKVISQKSHFDSKLGRTVYEYTKNNTTYYGYSKTSYRDPTYVANLIANPKDFTGIEGWSSSTSDDTIKWKYFPSSVRQCSLLKIPRNKWVLNTGIKNNLSYLEDGFQKGQKYIFRIQAYRSVGAAELPANGFDISKFSIHIGTYTISNSDYNNSTSYFTLTQIGYYSLNNWIEGEFECTSSITKQEIQDSQFGLLVKYTSNVLSENGIWIKDVQFFRNINNYIYPKNDLYCSDTLFPADHRRLEPGELSLFSIQETEYFYYNPNSSSTYDDDGAIKYEYCSNTNDSSFIPQYDYTCTAIRSISEKNSNRFNLIQKIAETFECYAIFTIEHNSDGSIIYGSKKVKFVENVGQETGLGFVYGLDLKTISRTIQSDQLVTKIIVPQNSNEFGTNGFCSIARSKENYSKANFILNFDYYISHGMLDATELNNDLYSSDSQYIGYLYHLRDYNKQYDDVATELQQFNAELIKQNASYTVYSNYVTSSTQTLATLLSDITTLCGATTIAAAWEYYEEHTNHTSLKTKLDSYAILNNKLNGYHGYVTQVRYLEDSRAALKSKITTLKTALAEKETLITALDNVFFKKYSRFIQEGTWSSEDYYDDNLYYLDAQSTLYTSSRPQVSYNISVLRLDALDEFKGRSFEVGDIGFIEDTEFFGYDANGNPYKEQILISESTENFDSPELDSFKVQNYKTQYEDLFQRITATTQSLQYASGSYGRAASAMNTNGTISNSTLQDSLNESQDLSFSTQNNNISYGNDGLVVKDPLDNTKQVRLSAGGLQITRDGGQNWKSALSPNGISTELLTAGKINTEQIEIYSEEQRSFIWNSKGINAISTENNIENKHKFVRFDQFGLYGYNGTESDADNFAPSSIADIKNNNNTIFGLTWDGFFLKNKRDSKEFVISPTEDLTLYTYNDGRKQKRIKIGDITPSNVSNKIYGMCIYDNNEQPVLSTDSSGNLVLSGRIYFQTWDAASSQLKTNMNCYIGPSSSAEEGKDNTRYLIHCGKNFSLDENGTVTTGALAAENSGSW